MPHSHFSKARPQNDQRAHERRHHSQDPTQRQLFPQEKRRAERDIDRRQIVHRSHICDRDPRHRVKPKGNASRMGDSAKPKELVLAYRELALAHRIDHWQQKHQSHRIAQKSRFCRRNARAIVFHESRHSDE